MKKLLLATLALTFIAGPVAACPISDWKADRRAVEAKLTNGEITINAKDCKIVREMREVQEKHQVAVRNAKRGSSNFRAVDSQVNSMWGACSTWAFKTARNEVDANGGWAAEGAPCAGGLGAVYTGGFGDGKSCDISGN